MGELPRTLGEPSLPEAALGRATRSYLALRAASEAPLRPGPSWMPGLPEPDGLVTLAVIIVGLDWCPFDKLVSLPAEVCDVNLATLDVLAEMDLAGGSRGEPDFLLASSNRIFLFYSMIAFG